MSGEWSGTALTLVQALAVDPFTTPRMRSGAVAELRRRSVTKSVPSRVAVFDRAGVLLGMVDPAAIEPFSGDAA